MANYTAADVKKLRDLTGSGMMDCKKALEESDGELDKAVELLRIKGAKDVGKRAGRDTANGLVAAEGGTMVELNCETDFVAKSADFQTLADKMIVMARIGGPFGIKGWIKVQPFTGSLDGLLEHQGWWLGRNGRWERIQVEDGAVHGRALIAKLQGCEDRQAAARLRGLEVAIPRDELPASAEGEYYWSDLIGLEVANRDGVALGRIARLIETGASPVLSTMTYDALDRPRDVLRARAPPEPHAHGAPRPLGREPERREHVRRLGPRGAAGRARRERDVLELREQRIGLDALERHVEVCRQATLDRPVARHAG
jgi:16S rRNA processing protein RimM